MRFEHARLDHFQSIGYSALHSQSDGSEGQWSAPEPEGSGVDWNTNFDRRMRDYNITRLGSEILWRHEAWYKVRAVIVRIFRMLIKHNHACN